MMCNRVWAEGVLLADWLLGPREEVGLSGEMTTLFKLRCATKPLGLSQGLF